MKPPPETIATFANIDALSTRACSDLIQLCQACVRSRGVFRMSLAGGSTPRRLYELMAQHQDEFPWAQVHLFWGDERNVPTDHDDSNYHMVRETLIDRVPIPNQNVHPVPIDPEAPAIAAERYTQQLRDAFGGNVFDWDLVLLGMGDDAHTASLFPGTSALDDLASRMVENWVEKFDAYRLTLTYAAINSARNIWFLIGDGKREALSNVWGTERDPHRFPSQGIGAAETAARWLITAGSMPSN